MIIFLLSEPIRPARKFSRSKGKRPKSVFLDDRGYPDPRDDFESLLPKHYGPLVRKRQHPAPRLDDIDPEFNIQYDEALHGDALRKDLNIDYLPSDQQHQLSSLIKEF